VSGAKDLFFFVSAQIAWVRLDGRAVAKTSSRVDGNSRSFAAAQDDAIKKLGRDEEGTSRKAFRTLSGIVVSPFVVTVERGIALFLTLFRRSCRRIMPYSAWGQARPVARFVGYPQRETTLPLSVRDLPNSARRGGAREHQGDLPTTESMEGTERT
jgi:hypothetical protein